MGEIVRRHLVGVMLALLLLTPTLVGCAREQVANQIPGAQARELSDRFVSNLLHSDFAGAHSQMVSSFRQAVSPKDFPRVVRDTYASYGTPLEAEFKAERVGYEVGGGGPFRKFWYALRTTKADKGVYYLTVQVSRDKGRLVCQVFEILTFKDGPPADLK